MSMPRSAAIALLWCIVPVVASLSLEAQDARPHPSSRQLAWQGREFTAFLHFGLNTFTDREWGPGSDPPSLFDPADLNARQIVQTLRTAGMRTVILTAKHHDGFCLWPTATTEYSVKHSPWKQGRGDVVREIADACREIGMAFGVYLSPWDRNNAAYGTTAYIQIYRAQLRELLTNYGEISEVWFDGANGGDGYYGGANETRHIDRGSYYDWPATWDIVRELQPNAVMFSDVGPDIRWVGNEQGFAGETNWSAYTPHPATGTTAMPGNTKYEEGVEGHRNGTSWIPAECDVSIRPGWFYHPAEDSLVRSPINLMSLWLKSVGRNAVLLLNVPPDRRGRIAPADSVALMEFRNLRERAFGRDLSANAQTIRTTDAVTLQFNAPHTFNCIQLKEDINQGQQVASAQIEAWDGARWQSIRTLTTVGYKRILMFPTITADRIRVTVTDPAGICPITEMRLYHVPQEIVSALEGT